MILGSCGTAICEYSDSVFLREPLPQPETGFRIEILRGQWGARSYSAADTFVRDESSGEWLAFCGNPVWTTEPGGGSQDQSRARRLLDGLSTKGTAALADIDGSFAIVWWHACDATLMLVRDRFGAEPLHYSIGVGSVVFGSRARDVVRALGAAPRLSSQGLTEFLTYCYLPGNTTLFEGIARVPPGSLLEWRRGGAPAVRRWYRLSFADPWRDSESAIAARYRDLLEASVVRRLDGGRPGVFLSGGLDSSSVATFMRRRSSGTIASFSFRCSGNSFDESVYARELANELGTIHTEVEYGEEQSLTILDAIRSMDTPFCDIGIEIGTWLLARAAGGQVDYLLTGDGGDEFWASHPVYAAQRMIQWYDRMPIPRALRSALVRAFDLVRDSDQKRNLAVVLKRILPSPEVPRELGHFRWRLYYTPDALGRLLIGQAVTHAQAESVFQPVVDSFEGYDGPDDGMSIWLHIDYQTGSGFYFSRLLLAREFGLEVRMPFYDRALVEYGARIPANLKLEGIERTKRLFRVAMKGVLPDIINQRKDKLGHSVPLKNWLRGNGRLIRLVRQTLESPPFRDRGLFRPEAVRRLLEEHERRRHNHSHRLWALFVLEHWLRMNVDTPAKRGNYSPSVGAARAPL
ncbi:MAG: asparagine synthetase B family protein [Gammaproteobacteria bacterium]